ncbi:activator of HSP90 ATPase [Planobispora rosea]|uniref:Activator of HSP90 ATPase n=2 Tax=Planobispora rosea TaxID=35762 RepID=A0A8J3RUD0_PLARO|nr:activator of HSP90 ATPase [Planobispora rosea]GIH81997.1 activator of HSP90 ATPase [Planobispora rosea]
MDSAGDAPGTHDNPDTREQKTMIDIAAQIKTVHREVGIRSIDGTENVAVLLRRDYDAPVREVWEALTDPGHVKRWFYPLGGDLRPGGTFQLEGNAGGRILHCEPHHLLRVTFGAETSVVELRLSPGGEGSTTLELEHTVPLEMAGSGAGALYVGPGWDGAFLALGLFVAGEVADDPVAAANSPEAQEFSRQSVKAWTAAIEDSGTAGPDDIAAAVEASLAQFSPDTAPSGPDDQA